MDLLAHQRYVTRLLLAATAGKGFVLAGSGAIREHAMIDRPTEDVDLFTDSLDADGFDRRLLAEQSRLAVTLAPRRVEQHGTGEVELPAVQDRLGAWARALRG
ncbi:hypothetical protein AB2L28_09865 [Kineococcus sp. TBRC 1896]|uniref:Nucleotidyltransferase AbiEii toxin of type IV toxin-antitoxin system n=1 Tax=Kineococcus mangrovi TaxID=1660183 RepID=A0ABV4I1J7_9ACTN